MFFNAHSGMKAITVYLMNSKNANNPKAAKGLMMSAIVSDVCSGVMPKM